MIQSQLRRLRQQDWTLRSGGNNTILSLLRRISKLVLAEIKGVFGVDSYLKDESRRVLEQVIFPYFLDEDTYRDVLFVGCSWCTKGYNKRFEKKKNYWTIDNWPWKKRYGAKQHIIDELQNLGNYFPRGALDLILCNGVFGYGLDAKKDVERAFRACSDCLREGGVFVIGWADIEGRRPLPLEACRSLHAFKPFVFPPLGTAEYLTDTPHRHRYTFYIRQ
jgi:SAM-dependent methyltransferase